MNKIQTYLEQINQAVDQMIELASHQSEEVIRWKPSEKEWSLMEVLCHVEECNDYWVDELQRIIKSPGADWGRSMEHKGRMDAVAKADQRSVEDVLQGVQKSKQKVNEAFATMKEEDLDVTGPHRNPKFGTRDMSFLVDHFMASHMETHMKQMERVLRQYQEK